MKKNAWVYEVLQARESLKKTCQCQRVFRNANAKRVTRKGVSPSYSGTRVEQIMLSSFPGLATFSIFLQCPKISQAANSDWMDMDDLW